MRKAPRSFNSYTVSLLCSPGVKIGDAVVEYGLPVFSGDKSMSVYQRSDGTTECQRCSRHIYCKWRKGTLGFPSFFPGAAAPMPSKPGQVPCWTHRPPHPPLLCPLIPWEASLQAPGRALPTPPPADPGSPPPPDTLPLSPPGTSGCFLSESGRSLLRHHMFL